MVWEKKLITKIDRTKQTQATQQQSKKWVTFTYYSPLVHKITNLFKRTNINIAFSPTNTILHLSQNPISTRLQFGPELLDLWNRSCEYVSVLYFHCDVMCCKILYICLNFKERIQWDLLFYFLKNMIRIFLRKIHFCMRDVRFFV